MTCRPLQGQPHPFHDDQDICYSRTELAWKWACPEEQWLVSPEIRFCYDIYLHGPGKSFQVPAFAAYYMDSLEKGLSLVLYRNRWLQCRPSYWFWQFCQSRGPGLHLVYIQGWEPCIDRLITCLCAKKSCTTRLEWSRDIPPVTRTKDPWVWNKLHLPYQIHGYWNWGINKTLSLYFLFWIL